MNELIQLDGVLNFRDLGGLPLLGGGTTNPGILYRSAAPSSVTKEGLEQISTSPLAFRVDFRMPAEREMQPVPSLGPEVEVIKSPIAAGSFSPNTVQQYLGQLQNASDEQKKAMIAAFNEQVPSLGAMYIGMLQAAQQTFANTARLVSQAHPDRETAVLIHCTAGKDRTGIGSALILSTVGATKDAIVADYAESERNLPPAWAEKLLSQLSSHGIPVTPNLVTLATKTPPDAIRIALDWVDENYGSASGYLQSGGLTDQEVLGLREALI